MRHHPRTYKTSKAFFAIAVFGLFSMCIGVSFAHAERIDSFNSRIEVKNDGTLGVTETIIYNPENIASHGIFRDIPLKNAQGRGMRISAISVADENGVPYKFTKSGFGTINLKIGDPDVTFLTPKTYVISYTISGAYSYFKDFDEIYWNVTGNSWNFPILNASAEVRLPSGTSLLQHACYYGTSGSVDNCTSDSVVSADSSIDTFYAPGALNSGEGLTIAVGFPKGVIPSESSSAKANNFTSAYLWILTLLVVPVSTFLLLLRSWRRKWRAPNGTGVVIPQYDAPQGLTPIEVVGVLNEKVPNKGISAELVYLATKGFIKIIQVDRNSLFFRGKDYELQKIKELDDDCNAADKLLVNSLFGSSATIKLSGVKKSFYIFAIVIKKAVIDGLVSRGLFRGDPAKVKNLLRVLGFFLLFCPLFGGGLLMASVITFFDPSILVSFFVGIAIAGLIVFVFSVISSTRTSDGVAAKEWILGFKEYLQIAEKDRINFHNAPEKRPETFEKFLPYAMVLGVERAWAKEFEGIYITQPNWYSGPTGATFSAIAFTNSLGSFNSMAASSLSSTPGGGSGGGGHSGGGGGGGGGGSW